MFHFLRRFLDCWKLARKIQRGELIAVRPGLLSAVLVPDISSPAQRLETLSAIQPPEAAIVAEEEPDLADLWHIRLNRDGNIKVTATFKDPRLALREWQAFKPNRNGAKVELYDVALGIVRGVR